MESFEGENVDTVSVMSLAISMLDSIESEVTMDADTQNPKILTQSTFRGNDRKKIKDWLIGKLV